MNKISFYIQEENLGETKQVIRSLTSLRFCHNPLERKNRYTGRSEYNFCISGDIEDINELSVHLRKYDPVDEQSLKSKGKFSKLVSKVFGTGRRK